MQKKTALDTPITSSVVAEPQRYFNMKGQKIRFKGRLILSFGFFLSQQTVCIEFGELTASVCTEKKIR